MCVALHGIFDDKMRIQWNSSWNQFESLYMTFCGGSLKDAEHGTWNVRMAINCNNHLIHWHSKFSRHAFEVFNAATALLSKSLSNQTTALAQMRHDTLQSHHIIFYGTTPIMATTKTAKNINSFFAMPFSFFLAVAISMLLVLSKMTASQKKKKHFFFHFFIRFHGAIYHLSATCAEDNNNEKMMHSLFPCGIFSPIIRGENRQIQTEQRERVRERLA